MRLSSGAMYLSNTPIDRSPLQKFKDSEFVALLRNSKLVIKGGTTPVDSNSAIEGTGNTVVSFQSSKNGQ